MTQNDVLSTQNITNQVALLTHFLHMGFSIKKNKQTVLHAFCE